MKKAILQIIRWMWCAECMTRQNFERTPDGWKCSACGKVTK